MKDIFNTTFNVEFDSTNLTESKGINVDMINEEFMMSTDYNIDYKDHGIRTLSIGGTPQIIDKYKNVDIDNLILDCGTSTTVI